MRWSTKKFEAALCVLLLTGLASSLRAELKFIDWIEASAPVYSLLREGGEATASQNWLMPRLRAGKPIPQASAREMALEIEDSAAASPAIKAKLRELLPSEISQFDDHRPVNSTEIKKSEAELAEIKERVEQIEASFARNNYNKGTFPTVKFNLGQGYYSAGNSGFLKGQASNYSVAFGTDFSGDLPSGSFGVSLGYYYNSPLDHKFFIGASGLAGMHGATWELAYGLGTGRFLSTLLYSGVSFPAKTQFYSGTSVNDVVIDVPSSGLRSNRGWFFRRTGRARWYWPFSDTQVVWGPTQQFYETWQTKRFDEFAVRVDLNGIDLIVFNDVQPYFTFVNTYSDEAHNLSFGAPPYLQNNRAYAMGLDGGVWGGGKLQLEGAYSDWSRSDLPQSYVDSAFSGNFSKSIGLLTVSTQYSRIGPDFLDGGRGGRRDDNTQAGAYLDEGFADPRPGNKGEIAYQQNMRESSYMTNNSERYGLGGQLSWSFASFSANGWVATDIRKSGPWIQSQQQLEGRPYNGHGWFDLFGQAYLALEPSAARPTGGGLQRVYAYNSFSKAPAYYHGKGLADGAGNSPQAFWEDIEQVSFQETATHILLSQNGIGDSNLREDSQKVLNTIRLSSVFDLKALFNTDLPLSLQLGAEAKESDESAHIPRLEAGGLLAQSVAQVELLWGLSPKIDLLGMLAYESWKSDASYFRIFHQERLEGIGMNFNLEELLAELKVTLRLRRLTHDDLIEGGRSFQAWAGGVSMGISY